MFESPATPTVYAWRSWIYMLLNFGLGTTYFTVLISGYAVALSLSIIWIGLPLLALMFSLTRRTARFDRWLASKFMGMQVPQVVDDLHIENSNPLTMVGAHLTSAVTWQDATYLFMKFPLGMVSMMMAMMALPFLAIETMFGLVGINTGMISGKILRAMSAGLSGALGGLTAAAQPRPRYIDVPRYEKAKNRLELENDPNVGYYITDDGEIEYYERKRKN